MASSSVSRLSTLILMWNPLEAMYPSRIPDSVRTFSSSVLPSAEGIVEAVSEMPSSLCSYGSFATLSAEATRPFWSRPCIGFAPGANGSPRRRPSGVLPVFLPYTTLLVIVSTDWVCVALR